MDNKTMSPLLRSVAIPMIAPLLFFAVASTPVEVIGCRTRGLLVYAIALFSVSAGVGAAFMALKGRIRKVPGSMWWALSALILALPAIVLIILA